MDLVKLPELAMEEPIITVQPMPQRSEIRSTKEDWTGKSSTAVRRKLQNRLNQRASRKRRGLYQPTTDGVLQEGIGAVQQQPETSIHPVNHAYKALARRPAPPQMICLHPVTRHSMLASQNFYSYLSTPLPADQKLLTLLHFNLVRALTRNIFLLGLDPDRMSEDIESPFTTSSPSKLIGLIENLPPTLHPTELQRTVPHHPEIDVLPFPRWRDNLILAVGGSLVDDMEFCLDILYGVDLDPTTLKPVPREPVRDCGDVGIGGLGGRTGLIVWSDPWLQSSWEVEEGFARKYSVLLEGCEELVASTNFWRGKRGETPLKQ